MRKRSACSSKGSTINEGETAFDPTCAVALSNHIRQSETHVIQSMVAVLCSKSLLAGQLLMPIAVSDKKKYKKNDFTGRTTAHELPLQVLAFILIIRTHRIIFTCWATGLPPYLRRFTVNEEINSNLCSVGLATSYTESVLI